MRFIISSKRPNVRVKILGLKIFQLPGAGQKRKHFKVKKAEFARRAGKVLISARCKKISAKFRNPPDPSVFPLLAGVLPMFDDFSFEFSNDEVVEAEFKVSTLKVLGLLRCLKVKQPLSSSQR